MAVNQIERVLVGQAARQRGEGLAAVAGAVDHETSVDGNAVFVLDARHKPGGVRIMGVDGHGKAEDGRFDIGELGKCFGAVLGQKDPVMVLAPDRVGIGGAAREAVDVLEKLVVGGVGRRIVGTETFAAKAPAVAAIGAFPDTAGGNGDR